MADFQAMAEFSDREDPTPAHITTSAERPTVDHIANVYRRYLGEDITFFTRVTVPRPIAGLTLQIGLPRELELVHHGSRSEQPSLEPQLEVTDFGHLLIWPLPAQLGPEISYEYEATVTINVLPLSSRIKSRAVLVNSQKVVLSEEGVEVVIQPKGRYLQFLPELYDQDDFMGRFLMLFESFWNPIESQIDNAHNYFDVWTTPPEFITWLASWLGFELDDNLPEARRRRLLQAAVSLFRRRGTRAALQEYLEIYTDGYVEIIEHRS